MMRIPGRLSALCAAILPLIPLTVGATNGMNMEGYGPIAAAMGGASMAYDNGSAAMMNNPATLGMMKEGDRLDAFFGFLGPDVESEAGGMTAKSDGDAYYMPAVGFPAQARGSDLRHWPVRPGWHGHRIWQFQLYEHGRRSGKPHRVERRPRHRAAEFQRQTTG